MKCAVGDLALVIGGMPENVGKMVTVVRLHTRATSWNGCPVTCRGPFWEVDRPLLYRRNDGVLTEVPYSSDTYLLPIRPEREESDEEIQAPRSVVLHSLRELHEFLGAK